jgi:hypothetical protein
LIEESAILTLHDLEAAAQVGGDPAPVIIDAFWHEAAAVTEAPVDRNWIPASKCLDDHVQHIERVRFLFLRFRFLVSVVGFWFAVEPLETDHRRRQTETENAKPKT